MDISSIAEWMEGLLDLGRVVQLRLGIARGTRCPGPAEGSTQWVTILRGGQGWGLGIDAKQFHHHQRLVPHPGRHQVAARPSIVSARVRTRE